MSEVPTSPDLDELLEFVNTIDIEADRDRIGTPERMAAWLSERGAMGAIPSVPRRTHARAIALREGLRSLGRTNNEEPADPGALAALGAATADLPLTVSLAPGSTWHLRPETTGADAYLATIVATALRAMADGEWSRVKACQNDVCRWLFIDRSRNRSRTWCTMAVCGSRMKSRTYRARQRTAT